MLGVAATVLLAGCGSGGASEKEKAAANDPEHAAKHLSKLIVEDTEVGKGEPVETGDDVWVNYTGKLADDTVFDTNLKPDGEAFHLESAPAGGEKVTEFVNADDQVEHQ